MVGSRGLGRVKSALLGSVSSGVLDHAHLPVLIVPPLEDAHAPGPVVIGYDGSEQADAAVEAAGRLLKVREAILQTVWTSYQAVAPAGIAGAPVAVVTKAAEEIDRGAREGAQRTAEQGARLAAAQGLEVRAEAVDGRRQRLARSARHRARPPGRRGRRRLARAARASSRRCSAACRGRSCTTRRRRSWWSGRQADRIRWPGSRPADGGGRPRSTPRRSIEPPPARPRTSSQPG